MGNAKPAAVPSPVQFGKYWLDDEIAVGGMARLLRARLRGPGGFEKKLVVKQILPQLARDPSFIELLVREANTLVQMSHPNIVPIYELGVVDGIYFLAMELVEGATVAELLREGPLPEALCALVGAQVCEALRYAHERFGLVHRDVTPRNIIVDADGHVRLLDFGIAAPLASTGDGELFGSPGYMSPEQTRGETLSARSDLFALGTVLYEALTLERPAPASPCDHALLRARGAELAELIAQLLEHDPDMRPSSAAEVAGRLRTWLAQTHPQGVAHALGQRAEHARLRAARPSARPVAPISSQPSASPGITRSIATSRQLSELLIAQTERLPAAARRGSAPTLPRRPRIMSWTVACLAIAWLGAWALKSQFDRGHVERRLPPRPIATAAISAAAARPAPRPAAQAQRLRALASTPGDPRALSTPAEPLAPAPGESSAIRSQSAPAPARAYLSINATPWADLHFDEKPLGTTPKRALSMPAGEHVLTLSCPPLGRQVRVPLQLAAGGRYQVLVDLQEDPPRVSVR